MNDPTIACTLDSAALAARTAAWRAVSDDALVEERRDETTITAVYARSDEIERRVRALVAAEAECCPFLSFDLVAGAGTLTLTVDAPPEAAAVIGALAGSDRASRLDGR